MNARGPAGFAIAAFGIAAVISTFARPANAEPQFAKAYGVNCDVCHTSVPQLNAYGRYVQRTGYSTLSRDLLRKSTPAFLAEGVQSDSQASTELNKVQFGNTAVHAGGYLTDDVTYHIHQWITQKDQTGDLDTLQFAYSKLFKRTAHLFVGKLSALPVPAPFSNGSDLSPYAPAEMTVGEHMYQFDMMRWGPALSYVRPTYFAEASWFGSDAGLNGAFNFNPSNGRTFQWIAALANSGKPLEAGAYGSVGTFPLSEGGIDRYNSVAAYVQRDPQGKHIPGIFALYQLARDGNPGMATPGGSSGPMSLRRFAKGDSGGLLAPKPANSQAWTVELYQPILSNWALLSVRDEMTDDGLGNTVHSGTVDLSMQPLSRYRFLRTYFETGLTQNTGPGWRWMVYWTPPLGGKL